jgi:hypothetical protein
LGSRGGMDGVRKITPVVGFDLGTVQLSQSRYQLRYPSPRLPTVRSSKRVRIIGHKVTSCTLQACIPTPNSQNLTSNHFFSFTSTKRHNKEGHKCSSCTRYCCCLQHRNMKTKNVSLGNLKKNVYFGLWSGTKENLQMYRVSPC